MTTGMLDRLDRQPAWRFLAILYLARWALLLPLSWLIGLLAAGGAAAGAPAPAPVFDSLEQAAEAFLQWVVLWPVVETLFECTLAYELLRRLPRYACGLPRRPWLFLVVSAALMAALHPVLSALLPSLITGAFLAYTYSRFAPVGRVRAVLASAGFHGAINLVGWLSVAV
ncbi:MAG: hypothetical protein H8E31_02770 [Planctomycetes bacterium]|nr:hypothetical protein [Planctomycetota bacterium]